MVYTHGVWLWRGFVWTDSQVCLNGSSIQLAQIIRWAETGFRQSCLWMIFPSGNCLYIFHAWDLFQKPEIGCNLLSWIEPWLEISTNGSCYCLPKCFFNWCIHMFSVDLISYLTRFEWDMAKYPIKQPLKNISEALAKVIQSFFLMEKNTLKYVLRVNNEAQ